MECPNCQSTNIRGNGKTRHGKLRYICRDCKRSFTGDRTGRPTIGDRPLTRSEIDKRHRGMKIHYQVPGYSQGYSACGTSGGRWKAKVTSNITKVTCKSCLRSIAGKKALTQL